MARAAGQQHKDLSPQCAVSMDPFQAMARQQQHKDLSPLLDALKSCSAARDLEKGKAVHAAAIQSSDDSNIYVANSLVAMYSKCGSLADAKSVFDRISSRTVASWNALMLGYVENGHGELALELLSRMTHAPNARSFATAVRACGILAGSDEEKLERLLDLHSRAEKCGLDSDIFVATSLVDAYVKCRRLQSSCKAFQRSLRRDVVLWTALILGCVENQEHDLALEVFSSMMAEGCKPNARTYVAAVKACSGLAEKEGGKVLDGRLVKMEALEKGVFLQALAAKNGFDTDAFLASTLIDMFAKCGSMVDARRIFDGSARGKDVVLWNAFMLGCAENGEEEAALEVFYDMVEFCEPNQRSFVALFKACSGLAAREAGRDAGKKLVWLEKAMAFHSRAAQNGFSAEMFVANSLVDLYAKCGSMADARRVFDGMESYDFVAWNTLLVNYVEDGQELLALELFSGIESRLQSSGVFVTALKACARYAAKEQGKQIDGKVLKLESLEKGMALHSQALKSGLDHDVHVSSSLVDMYASCGSCDDARKAFDGMKHHDVVSWSTLIDCFAENGQGKIALGLFSSMVCAGFSPNSLTYVAALKACASLVDFKAGSSIHAQVCRRGIEDDPVLATCLVDFFSKSGAMDKAQEDTVTRETRAKLLRFSTPCKNRAYVQTA
ncbi:pentatricopeptide repeat-containing protein At1g11290, chloroplastic-like [Selaginella moellendorffii]|uniref:pentatricopeptide repeat-containing protein At1g11290, chloroplastic-like n=1 Tax=Selaginella moellendorffii TaxID=88036 RepID=UPI000D1C7D98|nr:pentatricopeptide repeat-containing protein At1g11290, chloroplastic-like [Selaginella moellendorffii]|eukprot:XP_024543935.1 pentatricopeptide repeat-containing protein At1g11290, chloroplastic-like [Selaginella moellendorffii]